jgi:hypothetical protein
MQIKLMQSYHNLEVGNPDFVEQVSHILGQVAGRLHIRVAGCGYIVESQHNPADQLEVVDSFGQENHSCLGDFGMTL